MPKYRLSYVRNIGKREEQQDDFGFNGYDNPYALEREGFLSVLCDGMGGLVGGAEASRLAVDKFITSYSMQCACFTGAESDDAFLSVLLNALQEANEVVKQLGVRLGHESDCGTTLIAVLLRNDTFYWVSVGDSHIYLCHDGKLEQVNKDHIYANQLQEQVERGLISQEEANLDPMREALTSFIGIEELHEISYGVQKNFIKTGMDILLCSDGFYKFLGDEKLLSLHEQDAMNWTGNMLNAVFDLAHPYQDNCTAIAISAEDGEFDVTSKVTEKTIVPKEVSYEKNSQDNLASGCTKSKKFLSFWRRKKE